MGALPPASGGPAGPRAARPVRRMSTGHALRL